MKTASGGDMMRPDTMKQPHVLGALAAAGATAIGVVVMLAAGAPRSYAIINLAALAIGLALLAILRRNPVSGRRVGWLMLAGATALLATALFGTTIDEATRWVRIGVVSLQPSLVLLPLLVMAFARCRGTAATLAMLVCAAALALQPDRAMAGALLAGLAALAISVRERRVMLALAAALCGFAVTLMRPDSLPAMAFVEHVHADAFAFSLVAGLAVLAGSALLLLPALAQGRANGAVFAAVWLAILAAAVIGNYPTPLLGYGGSGILGYLLCLAVLPRHEAQLAGAAVPATLAEDRTIDGSQFAGSRPVWGLTDRPRSTAQ